MVLFIGSVFCTIYGICITSTAYGKDIINDPMLTPFADAFFCLIITQNILTTGMQQDSFWICWNYVPGLLIWQFWRVENETAHYSNTSLDLGRPSVLQRTIRIVAESGLLFTVVSFIAFMTVIFGDIGSHPITDAVCTELCQCRFWSWQVISWS